TPTASPSPSATPQPATSSAATASPSSVWGLPNPAQWAQQALAAVLSAFFSGALAALLRVLDWSQGLGGSAFNFITRTPPQGSYASSSVITLWRWVVGVADASLALVTMWGGYLVMSSHALDLRAHSAMRMVPRIALAALAANLSLAFVTFFIDLGNALSNGVGQITLPGYAAASATQQDLATLILAVVYAVVGFLLVAQMLLRLALLDVLIVLAPLGFLCWALPTTQAWARLWTSTFVATALVQFLQILALRLGGLLINELTPGRLDSATLTLLVGIAALALTFKLPGMLQNWALRSIGAASTMGALEQGAAVVQAIGSVAMMALA
ncbi:MAG TPA: conjugal transfer protein TrbL family protein, partial [Ktedonobacterales bacterium]